MGVGLLGNLTPCSLILHKPFGAMATGGLSPGLVPSLPQKSQSPTPSPPRPFIRDQRSGSRSTVLVFSMCMSDLAFLGCELPS